MQETWSAVQWSAATTQTSLQASVLPALYSRDEAEEIGDAGIFGGDVALLMLTLPWSEQPWRQQALQGLGLQVTGWSGRSSWTAVRARQSKGGGNCAAQAWVSHAYTPVHQA